MESCYNVIFLCLLLLQTQVVCAQECSNCRCCAEGQYKQCGTSDSCNYGCIDGYYGEYCIYKCRIPNCLRCDQFSGIVCFKCEAEYYLSKSYCNYCGTHCAYCDTNGCQSCQIGYYGNTCQWSCAAHCTSCRKSDGYCQSCESGYILRNYNCYDCGTHCASCGSTSCQSCHDGYWDNTCDRRCDQNCASCRKSDGSCLSCESGHFLRNTHCYNCGSHCASCESTGCQACDDGYWGSTCGNSCVQRCSESQCDQLTGYCLTCDPGYFGNKCENRCGQHCLICNQSNGQCTYCEDEYWGSRCTTCGTQCKTCDQLNGCLVCNDGYYGEICDKYQCDYCTKCREGYFRNYNYCQECKYKRNGCTCTHLTECSGCIDGLFLNPQMCSKCSVQCKTCKDRYKCTSCANGGFGQTCQYRCFHDCQNGICNEENATCQCYPNYQGEKCDQCKDGRYGETCGSLCSRGCELGTCLRETGFCACKLGYYGNDCQLTCPTGCLNNICNKLDGSCHSCKNGYFGKRCKTTCPPLCKSCDQNGDCTECKPGSLNEQNQCTCRRDICVSPIDCQSCKNASFFASDGVCCLCSIDKCAACSKVFDTVNCKICQDGYYPQSNGQCELCNSNCFKNECNSSSGRCLQGCINGYWNQTCDRMCEEECLSCSRTDGSCTQCKNNETYGPNCRKECSTTCKNSMCDIKGDCTNGCITNTFGQQCEFMCKEYCSSRENRTVCSELTGMCLYGCQTGYRGKFCSQEAEEEKQTTSPEALGGGIGGGVVALAVILVVGLILFRRRRVSFRNKSKTPAKEPENISALYATVNKRRASQGEYANEDSDNLHSVTIIENPNYQSPPPSVKERKPIFTEDNLEIDEDDASAKEIAVIFEENGGVYYNNAYEVSKFKMHVADLPEYVQNRCSKHIEEEFQKIPYGLVKAYEVSQTKLNMHKNRYRGIYPYDVTRVLVRGGETDYINASYIDGFRERNAYIATLGPTAKQLGDFGQFWRMVWQQEVEKIVMVTNLVEGKKTKCEQYWPDQYQSKLYGDIEVVCKVEKLYAEFIWRQFTLSKNSEERKLHHLQFTSWPDKDIPDDVTSVIEFRQRVNALPSTFNGPVVVHCSAGVGRTGTYIALDILTKEGETEGAIDIPGCVLNMRQNRPNMIQTLSQYQYLHQALVHTLTLDCSLIRREHFSEYMEKSSKQEIQRQFQKIRLSHEKKSDKELQAIAMNRQLAKKNRKHSDIPGDSNRPHLNPFLKTGESDYINAIYSNSLKTKQRFLVAQTPLPDTVADFIALAVQENCSCIVSMEAHMEKHKGIGLYFPSDNQTMKKGKVSVRSITDQSARHFVKRKLRIELEGKTKKDVTIPHYEYLDWDTKHNVPKSPELFVAFINEVEDVFKASHLKGPILLHCLNGAGKSGLFCVVSTLLQQLIDDNEVCVVNAVQKVRARRPLAIPNKEQFFFCYECVLHSVNAADNAVYYNISGDIQRE